MPKVKVNNLIKFYTLLLLSKEKEHGYELIKELEICLQRKVSASQVYPFLKILRKNGYISVKSTGKRKKKTYALTPAGKRFVKIMLSRFGSLIDIAVKPRLKVCAHCGCELYSGGYVETMKGRKLMFCCEHCAHSFKKSN